MRGRMKAEEEAWRKIRREEEGKIHERGGCKREGEEAGTE